MGAYLTETEAEYIVLAPAIPNSVGIRHEYSSTIESVMVEHPSSFKLAYRNPELEILIYQVVHE